MRVTRPPCPKPLHPGPCPHPATVPSVPPRWNEREEPGPPSRAGSAAGPGDSRAFAAGESGRRGEQPQRWHKPTATRPLSGILWPTSRRTSLSASIQCRNYNSQRALRPRRYLSRDRPSLRGSMGAHRGRGDGGRQRSGVRVEPESFQDTHLNLLPEESS